MKPRMRRSALITLLLTFSIVASPQRGGGDAQQNPNPLSSDAKLPNGKSQRDEILRAEHTQNIKDASELVGMAQQLQQDLEKEDTFVLSRSTLKKADDIEKLAKKIHDRLHH
jgi:hypothetical protein